MTGLAHRAEVGRLAALLHADPAELDFLTALPAEQVARTRRELAENLAGRRRGFYARAARAAGLLPGAVLTRMAQRALGPVLVARVAGQLPPERAADLSGRLPEDFLAEVCANLSVESAARIVPRLRPAAVHGLAARLVADDRHAVLADLSPAVPPELLRAVLAELSGADLVRVLFHADTAERLAGLADAAGEDRLAGLVRGLPGDEPDTVGAALSVVVRLPADRTAPLLAAVADMPDDDLGELARQAAAGGARAELRALSEAAAAGLPAAAVGRLASYAGEHSPTQD